MEKVNNIFLKKEKKRNIFYPYDPPLQHNAMLHFQVRLWNWDQFFEAHNLQSTIIKINLNKIGKKRFYFFFTFFNKAMFPLLHAAKSIGPNRKRKILNIF